MIKGFTCGAFDLLHTGHIIMLKETKKHCDYLIVGLQTDPSLDRKEKNKPIQSIYERFIQLNAVEYVDQIIPYDTEASLLDLLNSTHIDIRFLGSDHKNNQFTGYDLNIKHIFTSRDHAFSSTNLRNKIIDKHFQEIERLTKGT